MSGIIDQTSPDDLRYPRGVFPENELILSLLRGARRGGLSGQLIKLSSPGVLVQPDQHIDIEQAGTIKCPRFNRRRFSPLVTVACGRVCAECVNCKTAQQFAVEHSEDGLICEHTGVQLVGENSVVSAIAEARQVAREQNRLEL